MPQSGKFYTKSRRDADVNTRGAVSTHPAKRTRTRSNAHAQAFTTRHTHGLPAALSKSFK